MIMERDGVRFGGWIAVVWVLAGCGARTGLVEPAGTVAAVFDRANDPDHCGADERACAAAEGCISGVCTPVHGTLDLLLMVDNSGSMKDNEQHLMAQFARLADTLVNPPCASRVDPAGVRHPCSPGNPDDLPIRAPVDDLRVGVVSSDLGTAGFTVPGCLNPREGDDAQLNPIANGGALQYHLPWAPTQSGASVAPPGFRPDGCANARQFPRWIGYESAMDAGATIPGFVHDFECNAGLYVNGCGLESQLEAVWRALVWHGASLPDITPGRSNAGFLRTNAMLAIVVLSDEEDGSVQQCEYSQNPNDPSDVSRCDPGKVDVYRVQSTDWASAMDPNLRMYTYPQAGGAQDPTWSPDRYLDPAHPTHGLLGLKPGHPERILFTAITGVPLAIPTATNADGSISPAWDRLLGMPGPRGADDFYGRVNDGPGAALIGTTAEGPISMRLDNPDPHCTTRVVPSCYAPGTMPTAGCPGSGGQYYAWPSRRIVEVARRFDQSPLCHGRPCHSGFVTSICNTDYTEPVVHIAELVARRATGRL